jgi:hypothetical protein
MGATLSGHVPVAACIGCGARNHSAECPGGCPDVALDLVDAGALAAFATRTEALERRAAQLRALTALLVADAPPAWSEVRERARTATRLPVPAAPDVEVIEAWGCPRCGRIDAPAPCLGICVRRPGEVADVREYRQLTDRAERAAADDRVLGELARVVASVRPRPGREELTVQAFRSRARDLLGAPGRSGLQDRGG